MFDKKDIVSDKIVYGECLVEVIKVKMGKGNGIREYIVVYVLPKGGFTRGKF